MQTNLVIGNGEIGKAVAAVLEADTMDLDFSPTFEKYDVIHICIPYSERFIEIVKEYQDRFKPELTVIHSTVPLGTSEKCNAVHSPVRGVHPHLEAGVRTFVKFFGGKDAEKAAKLFEEKGVRVFTTPNARNTEHGKCWDTTQYGAFIELCREIYRDCLENGTDFDIVYTLFNETYNEGYTKLGRTDVIRPTLYYSEGKIGGHCVVPNARFLNTPTSRKIIRLDSERQ